MSAESIRTDICVVGGGPAGASAAVRLVELGYRVLLVDSGRGPKLAQHLAPSIWSIASFTAPLEHCGRFLASRRRLVRWGSDEPLELQEPGPPGMLVDRAEFDRLLLDRARASGVVVWQPAQAWTPQRSGDGWTVRVDFPAGAITVQAKFMVIATGRRPSGQRLGAGTAATYAWHRPAARLSAEARVEALPDAWLWSAPVAGGRCMAIVFTDQAAAAGLNRSMRQGRYVELLASSRLMTNLGPIESEVRVCDATAYLAGKPVEPGLIRVGDAALAIDPLSAQGVAGAIRGAMQASMVAHTMLQRPAGAAVAMRFYRQRLRRAAEQHASFAASLYAEVEARGTFWQRRTKLHAREEKRSGERVAEPLRPDTQLRWSEAVSWPRVPAIDGEFIRLKRAIRHPNLDEPVVFLDNVLLTSFLEPECALPACTLAARLACDSSPRAWRSIERLYQLGVLVTAL